MRRLLAVAALAALLLGGCGIPDETRVVVVGGGPSGGVGAGQDPTQAAPNTRESAGDSKQLLQYFLEAAAGDPETAADRVKAFLTPGARASFEAGPTEVRVIRLTGDPLNLQNGGVVTFNAQTIGTLKNGSLERSADSGDKTLYKFGIEQVAGQGFFISQLPPQLNRVLLLSDTALDQFYQRHTIYFWNTENTELIPDLRYMPRSVNSAQQPTTILNWLVGGPAGWLTPDVAHGLPDKSDVPENVPIVTNDTLTVTLSGPPALAGDAKSLDHLRRQLQWSLLSTPGPSTLELKIKGQDTTRYSGADYLDSNPADQLVPTPQKFAIYNGAIHRMVTSPQAGDPIPALRADDNKGIIAAAMSSPASRTFVAVVTSGKNSKLRVGSAASGTQATLHDVRGLPVPLGRPVWAVTSVSDDPQGATGLITANGKLYSFAPDGSLGGPVSWQGQPGPITAVSVAPDGYRVAIVAGGMLYRATLDTGGGSVALSTPERLFPPDFRQVTAVAWSSETYLAVAGVGADGQHYQVADVSVDGALSRTRVQDAGGEAVTYLTAYPANPTSHRENADTESYETAGFAWQVSSAPVAITASDLVGAPANPPKGQAPPTAPFYLF
ncbi:LpqB family beta-propeller domain-containing protein [Actinoplanes sp. KI2]|uniref:LpqB family beta-propeller domain-containing protein n=1 Tax=Actinoplanes sp. KI2 TaxID=2983315 RepID=UPI0021D5FEC5|nr:LpqB family beta-propeller domain-containing protein [Actinoplanes sp. KI2]MCU7725349.1 LpqB family beta-propeller domain-containing protein [Actinoplanes sp. KI2]